MQLLTHTKQQGMVTIVIALMLILLISIIILLVAKSSTVEQRISANQFSAEQAATAAQAGLEFSIPYLVANKDTIIKDDDGDGYIDNYSNDSVTNVAAGNGATFSIVYSNPVQGNLDSIRIQVTGKSNNNTSTRMVTQLMQSYSVGMSHPGSVALVARNSTVLSGNTYINNNNSATNQTIYTGNSIISVGNSYLTNSTCTNCSPTNPNAGTSNNNTTLQSATQEQFFENFFGVSMTTMQSRANMTLSTSADHSAALAGTRNKIIYIDGDANFGSSTTIGTAAEPVILIVNGRLNVSGNLDLSGFVYTTQEMNISGNVTLNGVAAAYGNINMSGNTTVNYVNTVTNQLRNGFTSYAPVPGSWRDF